jgi:hypothetical protein
MIKDLENRFEQHNYFLPKFLNRSLVFEGYLSVGGNQFRLVPAEQSVLVEVTTAETFFNTLFQNIGGKKIVLV